MRRARLGVLAVLLVVAAAVVFRGAGRWLDREDPLSHADVIFVVGGAMPQRALEAAKVFGMGYAPEVWLSRPDNPSDDLAKLGIHFVGEEDYNRQILIHQGVPEAAIHILPEPVVNTEEELQEVGREMRQEGKKTIILVTSPQHARRVWTLWQRLVGSDPRAMVHGAHDDPFDADHWWRNTRDVISVVHQTLG
ncbi:MAG TPA: YdcF family protein, partial [Terriglobales bacterium]|nr:YdcF family protein [Terriglobales bacterium]